MRPRFFGHYLLARGLVTAEQLLAAGSYQDRANARLGEYAVRLGLTTQFEIDRVCALQAREDLLFGDAAVRLGVLTDDQVQQIVAAQQDHHVRLGDALVALGTLDRQQVDGALAEFFDAEDKLEPEVVTIPEQLPGREIAFELFYLAHKLLLRTCELVSKTEQLCVHEGALALSDHSVRVEVRGAYGGHVLMSIPSAIARSTAARFSGEDEPADADVRSVVRELARLLTMNLRSVLAERGQQISLSEPEDVGESTLELSAGEKLAVVPFLTHEGQVLVGMRLP